METLDRLFAEARNEAPETTLSDVQKWIVPMTLGALIIAFFAKTKLIITLKPFIMISSAIVAVGIGTGVVLTMNTSTQQPVQPAAKNTIHVNTKQDPKPNETVLTSVNTPSQELVAEGEQQPVLRLLETLNDDAPYLPSLSYCQSLPSNYILPYKLIEPIQPLPRIPRITGDGEVTEINDFTLLKIWGAVDVVLMQGEKASFRIEGDDNGEEAIRIDTKAGTLEVYSQCKKNDCNYDLTVYITVVSLKEINCSGASSIKTEGDLNLESLKLEISGASDLTLGVHLSKMKINSSGASDINLVGEVDNLEIINSGASDINAEELMVQKANVNCSGASVVKINVMDDLKIVASGASEVQIIGDPSNVTTDVTGASEVKNIK